MAPQVTLSVVMGFEGSKKKCFNKNRPPLPILLPSLELIEAVFCSFLLMKWVIYPFLFILTSSIGPQKSDCYTVLEVINLLCFIDSLHLSEAIVSFSTENTHSDL